MTTDIGNLEGEPQPVGKLTGDLPWPLFLYWKLDIILRILASRVSKLFYFNLLGILLLTVLDNHIFTWLCKRETYKWKKTWPNAINGDG